MDDCLLLDHIKYASLPYTVQFGYVFICFLWDSCLCFQLYNARDMAQKTVIGQDQIVYSTDKDFLEQDFEANEWDKKFRELERSDWKALTVIWIMYFDGNWIITVEFCCFKGVICMKISGSDFVIFVFIL